MSRVNRPEGPSQYPEKGRPQVPGQVIESERRADRVLYGPNGEVLVRVEDRKQIGFLP